MQRFTAGHRFAVRRGAAIALATALAGGIADAQAVPRASASADGTALRRVVDSLFAQGFSGAILAADADGRIAVERYGGTEGPGAAPITVESYWRWASVSKQVSAVLVMREVERGRLSLDAPIDQYLPALRGPEGRVPTVRQLLQHSTNLANPEDTERDRAGVPRFYRDAAMAARTTGQVPALCTQRNATTPGERFAYNNCDFIVLTALLERVTGTSYPALVTSLRTELGAVRLGVADAETWTGNRGRGHVLGLGTDGRPELALRLGSYAGAGALMGTARDLLRFDLALLGGRLLADSSRRVLWTGAPSLGYAALGAWAFSAPLRGCTGPVAIVERRGGIGSVEVRNILLPESGHSLIVFTNRGDVPFGEIWQGRGLSYELLSSLACEGRG